MSAMERPRAITDYDRVVGLLSRLRGITIEDLAAGLYLPFREVAAMIDEALRRGELVERPLARNPTGRPCEILLVTEAPALVEVNDVLSPSQASILRELMRRRRRVTGAELRVVLYGEGDDRSENIISVTISQMRAKLKPFGVEIAPAPYGAGWSLGDEDKARVRALFGEVW